VGGGEGSGHLSKLNLNTPCPAPSQACAPLYSWRTEKDPQNDPVGTCYLSTENFTRILEYAPCRSGRGQSVWNGCAFSMGGPQALGA